MACARPRASHLLSGPAIASHNSFEYAQSDCHLVHPAASGSSDTGVLAQVVVGQRPQDGAQTCDAETRAQQHGTRALAAQDHTALPAKAGLPAGAGLQREQLESDHRYVLACWVMQRPDCAWLARPGHTPTCNAMHGARSAGRPSVRAGVSSNPAVASGGGDDTINRGGSGGGKGGGGGGGGGSGGGGGAGEGGCWVIRGCPPGRGPGHSAARQPTAAACSMP